MKFILAASINHVIGIENKLPWHIPHDLKWFKMNTYGKNIIMGRKTYDSMPKLKDRHYHVVTSKMHPCKVDICHLPDGICIGGAQLFQSLISSGDILYLTHVLVYINHPNSVKVTIPPKKLLWRTKIFKHKDLEYYFAAYKIL